MPKLAKVIFNYGPGLNIGTREVILLHHPKVSTQLTTYAKYINIWWSSSQPWSQEELVLCGPHMSVFTATPRLNLFCQISSVYYCWNFIKSLQTDILHRRVEEHMDSWQPAC